MKDERRRIRREVKMDDRGGEDKKMRDGKKKIKTQRRRGRGREILRRRCKAGNSGMR